MIHVLQWLAFAALFVFTGFAVLEFATLVVLSLRRRGRLARTPMAGRGADRFPVRRPHAARAVGEQP